MRNDKFLLDESHVRATWEDESGQVFADRYMIRAQISKIKYENTVCVCSQ